MKKARRQILSIDRLTLKEELELCIILTLRNSNVIKFFMYAAEYLFILLEVFRSESFSLWIEFLFYRIN